MQTMQKAEVKRYIVRGLDKVTGVKYSIIVYGKEGVLHTVTKEGLNDGQAERIKLHGYTRDSLS